MAKRASQDSRQLGRPAYSRLGPEAQVRLVTEYLHGWLDAVMRTAPDMTDELAMELEKLFCAPDADEATLLVAFEITMGMPELASEKGFDCIFLKRKVEDVVLWRGLDAWRQTDLPLPSSLARIQKSAQDQRTRDRFKDPVELRNEREEEQQKVSQAFLALPFEERVRLSESPGPQINTEERIEK